MSALLGYYTFLSFARWEVVAPAGLWERGSEALASGRVFPLSKAAQALACVPSTEEHRAPKAFATSPSGETGLSTKFIFAVKLKGLKNPALGTLVNITRDITELCCGLPEVIYKRNIEFTDVFIRELLRVLAHRQDNICGIHPPCNVSSRICILCCDQIKIQKCAGHPIFVQVSKIFSQIFKAQNELIHCTLKNSSPNYFSTFPFVIKPILFEVNCLLCCSVNNPSSDQCSKPRDHSSNQRLKFIEYVEYANEFRVRTYKFKRNCDSSSCSYGDNNRKKIQKHSPIHTHLPRNGCAGGSV